jgi:competence protein ComFB
LDIKNFLEEGVASYVDEALAEDDDFCKCRRCRLDVMALALNELKPKYVVTPKGYAFARSDELEAQFLADTIIAVRKAMVIVRDKPRHQPERGC